MRLYYHPASNNCRRVTATIYENKLDDRVEMKLVDLMKGEHKTPDFLRINPNGKVPALEDGELKLWESTAIMQYLSQDSPLWPKSNARYDIIRWQCWGIAHWGRAINDVAYERLVRPMIGAGAPDEGFVARGLADVERYMPVLDQHLADRQWVVGDSITLADYALAADLTYAGPAGIPVAQYEHVTRWYAQIEAREAWQRSAPPKRG